MRLEKGCEESGQRILKYHATEFEHHTIGDSEVFSGGSGFNISIFHKAFPESLD